MGLAPPTIDLVARLRQNTPGLMAEIKRASPSKGDIDLYANAAKQAQTYALAGANAISVLTEPTWFKGSLCDLKCAREAISTMANRPAILRKEFIFDEYQILEARLNGADSVLLIVAMLEDQDLIRLYNYSKCMGMEPLVEVNNVSEMERALKLGARAIGVNNRNLHSFKVDLETTSNLASMVPSDIVLCALSGITKRADVEKFVSEGVGAVLVGESLMRAPSAADFIAELLGRKPAQKSKVSRILTKICGMRSVEAAITATENGAAMVGIIFAKKSSRRVSIEIAQKISWAIHSLNPKPLIESQKSQEWFSHYFSILAERCSVRPQVVGVFMDNSLDEILRLVAEVPLDLVQLHGSEPDEWARLIPVPVIRSMSLANTEFIQPGYYHHVLLDASDSSGKVKGGSGTRIDLDMTSDLVKTKGSFFILAGGLTPENVVESVETTGVAAIDVASGVETEGIQDCDKIKAFMKSVENIHF